MDIWLPVILIGIGQILGFYTARAIYKAKNPKWFIIYQSIGVGKEREVARVMDEAAAVALTHHVRQFRLEYDGETILGNSAVADPLGQPNER